MPGHSHILRIEHTLLEPEPVPLVHLGERIGQAPGVVGVVTQVMDVRSVVGREDQSSAGEELDEVAAARDR